jgi:2-haloacid dehalogenase
VGTIRAVIWDLGGVLICWDPRALYRRLMPEPEVDPFLAEIGFTEWNHAQDAGRSMPDGVAELAGVFPHRRALIEAYAARFGETMLGPVPGSVELLGQLRSLGAVRLFALTNWSADTFHLARRGYDFLDWFEAVVVSGEERLAKPDPQLFRLLLERHRLRPRSTVFIDDSPANIRAATALGLIGLLFTDADALRADLSRLGLLPPL